jgi:hypothetical protein
VKPALLVFCEAPADFEIAARLTDRILRERGPSWVQDHPPEHFDQIRCWVMHGGVPFIEWHQIAEVLRELKLKPGYGHFDGKPGLPDAVAGRNALQIARRLARTQPVDAAYLLRDADGHPKRREGLEQARDEAQQLDPERRIVVGLADRCRESWVIVGFVAMDQRERERLDGLKRELSFDPCCRVHALRDPDEGAPRSPKRVLATLAEGDRERERRCVEETPLETLWQRGKDAGLASFLEEIETQVVPLFGVS